MTFHQHAFDIRFEWGLEGVEALTPGADVVVIVDVLSFSTCVDIATARGAIVFPYRWKDASAQGYARAVQAELASFDRKASGGFSLSPASLLHIPAQTRLVLPSPNGATLSLATGNTPTLCGCLRNAEAVAKRAREFGRRVAIIAAGEQWPGQRLRPAFEDLVGAGAIISYLDGRLSPESKAALAAFRAAAPTLLADIRQCGSGLELQDRGFAPDVLLACELNASRAVPLLTDGYYVGQAG